MDQKYIEEMAGHLAMQLNPDPATAMMEQKRIALFLVQYWKDKIAVVRTTEDVMEACHKKPSPDKARLILRDSWIEAENDEVLDEIIEGRINQEGYGEGETRPLGEPKPYTSRLVTSIDDLDDDE